MTQLRTLLTGLGIGLFFCACSATQPEKSQINTGKPNIIVIMSDDQGYADHGASGLIDVNTPNLDRLANQGMRFTQAYATAPICNAARAGLMTGQYQQRQNIYWYGGSGIQDASIATLAEVLKPLGYYNGYVGKFHYGKTQRKDSTRRDFPLNHGFDYFYGFEGGRKHYINHKEAIEEAFQDSRKKHKQWGQSLAQGAMWNGRELVDQEGFATDLFADKAIDFLQDHKDESFYLHLSFNAVHNFTHQIPEQELKKRGLKGYHDWDPAKEDYRTWYLNSRYPNLDEGRALYLAQLEMMDQQMGRILDYIEDSKLRENTLIIYISDNGGSTPIYADNTPLRGSKYTLYEGGIRIPMFVSLPTKIAAKQVSDQVVSTLDVMPTICSFIDECQSTVSDGMSIEKVLTGKQASLHRAPLVWDTSHEVAVRDGDWKLKIAKPSSQKHAKYEVVDIDVGTFLYNLKNDPAEQHDLSEKHPEIVQRLLDAHKAWQTQIQ